MKRRDLLKSLSAATGFLAIGPFAADAKPASSNRQENIDVLVVGGGPPARSQHCNRPAPLRERCSSKLAANSAGRQQQAASRSRVCFMPGANKSSKVSAGKWSRKTSSFQAAQCPTLQNRAYATRNIRSILPVPALDQRNRFRLVGRDSRLRRHAIQAQMQTDRRLHRRREYCRNNRLRPAPRRNDPTGHFEISA